MVFVSLLFTSCGSGTFDHQLNDVYNEANYVATLSHEITELTAATWSSAISDKKDHRGNYCSDFNVAIQRLYTELKDASVIGSLENHYNNMETLAKQMSNCPNDRKEVFNEIVEIVAETKNIYKIASEPSGNLQQYSQESRQTYSSLEKTLSQFEIKHSNILSNVKKQDNLLLNMLADYRIQEEEIKAKKREAGITFLRENKSKEGVVEQPSGLQIKSLLEGNGIQPVEGSKVLVKYEGSLIDGTVFDANDSVEFNVNGVVLGLKEGLLKMKEGGRSILYIPYNLAYGDRGAGDNIPGGSAIIFDVTLYKVTRR